MKSLLLFAVLATGLSAQDLRIFAIDVEGGKSTLYVSPSGESMLIDTGFAANNNRDADRIAAAASAAGIKRIDHLVITHFHGDHVGGVAQLVAKIPIGHFYDHGESFELSSEKAKTDFKAYTDVRSKYPHTVLHPGDTIPVKGLQVQVVSSAGEGIKASLAGAGQPNPLCSTYKAMPQDPGENAHSLAFLITFGSLRIADLGDLFWNQEFDLACPVNKIGTVDLYMTTHHGANTSGMPQIVHAMHPRVAIMNNAPNKGGSHEALATIRSSPGLLDLWQLHYSNDGGAQHNTSAAFIANPEKSADGNSIEVDGQKNGTFTVRIPATRFEKTYTR